MKKKILTLVAIATLALAMTACGTAQTSNNPTPTVEPTKEVEATTAPTVEPTATSTPVPTTTSEPTATNTPTPEPTATSTPTPEPTSLPYAEEKGIKIENITEFESSFLHYVVGWESEEETAFPGLTTQSAGCKVVIDSVTQKAAEKEGYTTFTVLYHLDCVVKQSVDTREGDSCGWIVWCTPNFTVCDYYTGFSGINNLVDGGIGTAETVLNWNGQEIKITVSLDEKFEWSLGEWNQESDYIYSMLCPARKDCTVTLTVPEGYDGLMLQMGKELPDGQGKAAVEEVMKNSGGTGWEMFWGESKAEDFYFIRLTDIAKKITETEPSATPTPEPTPTSTPEPTATPEPTKAPEPTATPEPTEVPEEPEEPEVDDASKFVMLKGWTEATKTDYYAAHSYKEYADIIETMDSSRYVTTAVEGLDPVLKADLADKQSVVDTFLSEQNFQSYKIQRTNKFGQVKTVRLAATPTGEMYTMTLTDTVTGETFVWGFRVHVEANDEPGTYYVHEESVCFITDMQGTLGKSFVTDNFIEDYQFEY